MLLQRIIWRDTKHNTCWTGFILIHHTCMLILKEKGTTLMTKRPAHVQCDLVLTIRAKLWNAILMHCYNGEQNASTNTSYCISWAWLLLCIYTRNACTKVDLQRAKPGCGSRSQSSHCSSKNRDLGTAGGPGEPRRPCTQNLPTRAMHLRHVLQAASQPQQGLCCSGKAAQLLQIAMSQHAAHEIAVSQHGVQPLVGCSVRYSGSLESSSDFSSPVVLTLARKCFLLLHTNMI